MSVALVLISDGRDELLDQALVSAAEKLPRDAFAQHVWVDDREHELGFAGAVQAAWEQVETDYVFHLEQDFALCEHVELDAMIALLERHPELAQVSLKRQAWNAEEKTAGGIVELHPRDFTERHDDGAIWTEHRRYWTTNPSVYSSRWCRQGWPQESQSEGLFTHRLLRDPLLRFAIWGGKFDPPRATHLGDRTGHGY